MDSGMNEKTEAELGDWLTRFAWDHWATLTTPIGVSKDQTLRWRATNVRWLEQRAQQRVDAFWKLERSPGGMWHVHTLLYGTGRIAASEIEATWKFGRAQADLYRHDLGAAHYLARGTAGEFIDWDAPRRMPPMNSKGRGGLISGGWPVRPGEQLNAHACEMDLNGRTTTEA